MAENTNKQVYENIENNIKNSLNEGLNTGDFSKLNSAIANSVMDVVREAGVDLGNALNQASGELRGAYKRPYTNRAETEAYARMLQEKRKAHLEEVARAQQMRASARYSTGTNKPASNQGAQVKTTSSIKINSSGRNKGTALIIFGSIGAIFSGARWITALISFLIYPAGGALGFVVSTIITMLFLMMIRAGVENHNLFKMAERYIQIAGHKMYAQVSSLSAALGISTKKVKKSIKKMLKKGYFPEGYFDEDETTLMLSNSVYQQYQQTKTYASEHANDKPIEEPLSEAMAKLSQEDRRKLKNMVDSGNGYINRLHALNDDIPGEEISIKLSALEDILREIFSRIQEHPEQMDRMSKLMDYYLPTMIKLVEAYAEYDKVSAPGKDIIEAKAEIEQTLDTINEAFIQLLNNLFQDSVWDVTTDAQVLKTMLKQEGLT